MMYVVSNEQPTLMTSSSPGGARGGGVGGGAAPGLCSGTGQCPAPRWRRGGAVPEARVACAPGGTAG